MQKDEIAKRGNELGVEIFKINYFQTLDPDFDRVYYEKNAHLLNFDLKVDEQTNLLPKTFTVDNKHAVLSWEYTTEKNNMSERIAVDLICKADQEQKQMANFLAQSVPPEQLGLLAVKFLQVLQDNSFDTSINIEKKADQENPIVLDDSKITGSHEDFSTIIPEGETEGKSSPVNMNISHRFISIEEDDIREFCINFWEKCKDIPYDEYYLSKVNNWAHWSSNHFGQSCVKKKEAFALLGNLYEEKFKTTKDYGLKESDWKKQDIFQTYGFLYCC